MESKRRRGSDAWTIRSLMRRKHVDSDRVAVEINDSHRRLAKKLSVLDLIAIGIGSTIGAGVYVLVGTVAHEHSGPGLTVSFLIAGIAAASSAFCYAELASRCPSAGSAYHYSYICVGEGVAWLIGWALILEYTIGGSAVARGISPNLALFFGGTDSLPTFLSRILIPGINVVVDPCAAVLVLVVTGLLCVGIRESSIAQTIVTTANVCILVFVIIAGGYLGFKTGWIGYSVVGGYFPYGWNGVLAGSATVFFSYIGFDAVASTAEEVKHPQRDLPLGIGLSLSICCLLYMLVSTIIVGLVPYFAMDPDVPISSAFSQNGMDWAVYVISAGAVLALCASLMGSILPQPRILMAMARDGLLPPLFSNVNKRTQVPFNSTLISGIIAAALAFFMDVSELAGMVSVGTLLAFTIVAISILILRYVPPNEIPVPPSLQQTFISVSPCHGAPDDAENQNQSGTSEDNVEGSHERTADGTDVEASSDDPFIVKEVLQGITLEMQNKTQEKSRRRKAAWSIAFVCLGSFLLTLSASITILPVLLKSMICAFGGFLLLGGLSILSWINEDNGHHSFGHTGGFICPFVPVLPVGCILINIYLLVNLGIGTWLRVSIWLLIGILVYLFYGRTHSALANIIYLPAADVDKILDTSSACIS